MRSLAGPALTAAAVGLVPIWSHIVLVDSGLHGIISVFREVAIYPSDVCLGLLAAHAVVRPVALDTESRWIAIGLTALSVAALLSAATASDPALASGVAAQLSLLTLAWLGVRSFRVSRTLVVAALITAASLQAGLAAAQFISQQTLVPAGLGLPWLPSNATQSGAPVILDPTGDRLLRGFGTFPHPNILSGYLGIALVCLPVLLRRWPRAAPLFWGAGGMLGVGLLATFSRAAWLAALVGLAICRRGAAARLDGQFQPGPRQRWTGIRKRHAPRWMPVVVGGAALMGVGLTPLAPLVEPRLFPFGPTGNALERGSVQNRLALDNAALGEIADHWPWGIGASNYGLVSVEEGYQEGWGEPVPNVALLVVAELGLPGVVALALLAVAITRFIFLDPDSERSVTAAVVGLIVLAMFDHYLWTMPLGRVIAWTPFALYAAHGHQGVRMLSN